jgi:hypothetical protein
VTLLDGNAPLGHNNFHFEVIAYYAWWGAAE